MVLWHALRWCSLLYSQSWLPPSCGSLLPNSAPSAPLFLLSPPSGHFLPAYSSPFFFQILHTYVTCMGMYNIHTCKLEYKFHTWRNHAVLVFLILFYSLSLMLFISICFLRFHFLRLCIGNTIFYPKLIPLHYIVTDEHGYLSVCVCVCDVYT